MVIQNKKTKWQTIGEACILLYLATLLVMASTSVTNSAVPETVSGAA